MGNPLIHLVVDTNLFFECRRLEELPWRDLGADEIVLLLTKPVLDEIDKHKKGSGRTRKRALDIFKRVRTLLENEQVETTVQEAGPKVTLRLAQDLSFDSELADQLDRTKPDDRLVGILSSILKANPENQACLFTHDTGPASTAQGLGLPFRLIRDTWLRQPEQTSDQKKISELEQNLAAYRAQEPEISIELEQASESTESIELVRLDTSPLTEAELEQLMSELEQRYPKVTDFDAPRRERSRNKRGGLDLPKLIDREPPTDEEKDQYLNTDYPNWLGECRERFAKLHESLVPAAEEYLRLSVLLTNVGSRPAKRVNVRFQADGDIFLIRPDEKEENDEDDVADNSPSDHPTLPPVPTPPKGAVVVKSIAGVDIGKMTRDLTRHSRVIDELTKKHSVFGEFARDPLLQLSSPRNKVISSALLPRVPPPPDPEAFYYRKWSRGVPVKAGRLTCDLWRHKSEAELFEIDVWFGKRKAMSGSVLCEVHAENLTCPAKVRFSVQQTLKRISVLQAARKMIVFPG